MEHHIKAGRGGSVSGSKGQSGNCLHIMAVSWGNTPEG